MINKFLKDSNSDKQIIFCISDSDKSKRLWRLVEFFGIIKKLSDCKTKVLCHKNDKFSSRLVNFPVSEILNFINSGLKGKPRGFIPDYDIAYTKDDVTHLNATYRSYVWEIVSPKNRQALSSIAHYYSFV